jgi:hypothetical protein
MFWSLQGHHKGECIQRNTDTANLSGFGGLEDACWPLVPKFAGSNLAEAVGFLGRKNPQHGGPMS